ncbi:hypothetical protein HZC53_03750 [Candidatus Uhrbacteria bacterium]|nr:hypothetical protein [Candidatus Uhrbacteria bacterium]
MFTFGLAAGAIAGAIMLFLSHLAPYVGAGNFVRDLDVPHVFGREITRREAHVLGVLVHMLLTAAFGGLFLFLYSLGIFADLGIISVLEWGLVVTIFMGGVVMPIEGHGLFGINEDVWFPLDLLMTYVAWAAVYWWILQLWQSAI